MALPATAMRDQQQQAPTPKSVPDSDSDHHTDTDADADSNCYTDGDSHGNASRAADCHADAHADTGSARTARPRWPGRTGGTRLRVEPCCEVADHRAQERSCTNHLDDV